MIRLLALGDIYMGGEYEKILDTLPSDEHWKNVSPQLESADYCIANLESPFTNCNMQN